jgi:hypothetical protein
MHTHITTPVVALLPDEDVWSDVTIETQTFPAMAVAARGRAHADAIIARVDALRANGLTFCDAMRIASGED